MATMSLNLSCSGRRDNESIGTAFSRPKTRLDDKRLELGSFVEPVTWRCDSVCNDQSPVCDSTPHFSSWSRWVAFEEICKYIANTELSNLTCDAACIDIELPPPYTATITDAPPTYELLQLPTPEQNSIALKSETRKGEDHSIFPWPARRVHTPTLPIIPMTPAAIDFNDTSTFRQAAKKNAKKKATQGSWADDAGEGANDGGEGAGNAGGGGEGGGGGGGGAGGSNNGDGGAGDDGGGDEWNFGGGKKKKKGKKGKNAIEEEEEQKEKEEEEKKKMEDSTGGGQDLSWMDDPAGKPEDEWATFTGTEKKGKKNKKGKIEPAPEPQTHNAFEDINLGGDTPHLDLNFGTDTGTKGSGAFGGGGWGSSWDTGNTWGFSGIGNGAADITDSKKDALGAEDTGAWSFGKKNKKTTTTASAFDFGDLVDLDEGGESQAKVGGDQDDWDTSFTTAGKKGKKNKKNAIEDSSNATDTTAIGTASTEATTADDSWSPWGTSTAKKDKNKKKKNEPDPPIVEVPPVPPPPPAPPVEAPVDDMWNTFGTKSKKKNKKGAIEEIAKVEEPIVVVPDPEPEPDLGWSSFGAKKDKKKGKKDATEEKKTEPDPIVEVPDIEPESKPEPDFDWGFSGKKDKKKGKKAVDDDKNQKTVIPEPQKDDTLDLSWGGFGTGKKDTKKGKKDPLEEPKAAVTVVPDPEPETSFGWGGFGTKKTNKKGKKTVEEDEPKVDDIVAVVTDPDPDPISGMGWGGFGSKKDNKKKTQIGGFGGFDEESFFDKGPEAEPVVEDSFDAGWGSTTKKGKKDKKGGVTEVKEDTFSAVGSMAATEAASKTVGDDWMNWGSDKKKDKKNKKGITEVVQEEALPPPPPPVPEAPPTASSDIWGGSKKDKKGKKGKLSEPEPAVVEVPELPPAQKEEVVEDDWGSFALSPKDKKKKEKERERQKKEEEAKAKKEQEELEAMEKEEEERKAKEEKEKEKEKAKPGKKGKASVTTTASKAKDLMAGSVPDTSAVVEDDFSSSIWGSSKKDSKKKTGKKESAFDVPPPVPTPPAQGLTPPPEDDLDDLLDGDWGGFGTAKDKDKNKKDAKKPSKADELKASKTTSKDKASEEDKKVKAETPAKAARSFWGGMASTSASKPKPTTEEKESKKTINDLDLDAYLDPDEIVDIIEEEPPPKKGSKAKSGDSKLSKTASKDDKAKKAKGGGDVDALLDFGFDETSKTVDTAKGKDEEKSDAWGFWGSSKKTTGKKGDESKKEISKAETTNKIDALAFLSNEPEPSPIADEPAQFQTSKSSKSAMSASKTTPGKLSVAQKVKALEKERKEALEKTLKPPAPPPVPEPEIEPPAKKTSAASKSKGLATSKFAPASKKKDKDPSPPPEEEEKKTSKDSVPGSFPAEGFEEENLIDMLASTPVAKKTAKKGAKTAKKEPQPDFADMDFDLDVPVVPAAPPTPPAETVAPKPVKKERPRVVRDQGASSWGFWGAAPKKDDKKAAKAKDDADVPTTKKTATPALVRSKSTKTPKEKEKDTEKSSSSDAKEKKAESRPSKSRGSSFGGLFGGPPPARTKPVRRVSTSAASKTTTKRQSMDMDAFGLPSPPPDDSPATNGKAAKLMGTTPGKLDRKASTKGKQKAAVVPDPYPIDDDDMVMVNGIEDPIINAPIPKASGKSSKDKSSRNKSSKESKPVADAGDDIVMVDGPSQDEPELLAFDEKPRGPPPLRRSTTSAKKPQNGKLMGLFGGFGKARDVPERPRTKAVITDDEAISPRKRTVNGRENSSKRIRRDDRKVRRPEKEDGGADVFITDALNDGGAATEHDEAQLRRQERRAKREARDSEDRRARRDVERAPDESRKAKTSERRSKREDDRPRKESVERSKHSSSRPHKSDRRRSYMESPLTSDRPKAHRSRTEQSSKKRESVPPAPDGIDDYFNSRNAAAPQEGAAKNEPYMHGANDHTSSWVKSQLSEPADPPPVEGTVIEPAPELGGKGGYEKSEEQDARRAARKARRQSRYGGEDDAGEIERERRRRRKEKGSEGSAAEWGGREREKLSRRYTDMGGIRELGGDARPSLGAVGKRGSWLKKVVGM